MDVQIDAIEDQLTHIADSLTELTHNLPARPYQQFTWHNVDPDIRWYLKCAGCGDIVCFRTEGYRASTDKPPLATWAGQANFRLIPGMGWICAMCHYYLRAA